MPTDDRKQGAELPDGWCAALLLNRYECDHSCMYVSAEPDDDGEVEVAAYDPSNDRFFFSYIPLAILRRIVEEADRA